MAERLPANKTRLRQSLMKTIALLYHDVIAGEGQQHTSGFQGADADLYKLDARLFNAHLHAIREANASQPVLTLESPQSPASKRYPLLLTFDDGGASAITQTAQALAAYGWLGYFFITTDYIGSPGFLNAEQIRALHQIGHVIGSHSCSHPLRMSACSEQQLSVEWGQSIKQLSQILGGPVHTASVPGGHYSRRVGRAASQSGIKILFTSEPTVRSHQIDDCLVLGRFSVQRSTPASNVAAIARGEILPRLAQAMLWNAKKVVKIAGGTAYLKARKALLRDKSAP